MVQNFTLAWLIDKIERKYGRMTNELRADLYDEINLWVNRLCKRWNFWFLEVLPGQYAMSLFPLSDATLSAYTFPVSGSRWFDLGWFMTAANQVTYPFLMPYAVAYDLTDTTVPQQAGERWNYAPIKQIKHLYRYSKTGACVEEVEVLPPAEYHRIAQYQTSGIPKTATWSDDGQQSTIQVNPKPNDIYIYQAHLMLAGLPPLDRPHATHAFLQHYPHAMVAVGCLGAAQYFNEQDRVAEFMFEVYGPEWKQQSNPNFMPGGHVGEILADSRKRRQAGADMTMKVFPSEAQALGRRGARRRVVTYGRYYYYEGN